MMQTTILLLILGAVVGTVLNKCDGYPHDKPSAMAIKAACNVTLYPDSCFWSISSADDTVDPEHLFKLSLKVAIKEISNLTSLPDALSNLTTDKMTRAALRDCKELLYDAWHRLNESIELLKLSPGEKLLSPSEISMLRSWISANITDQVTCLDELENKTSRIEKAMAEAMVNSTQYTSNSLAIVTKLLSHLQDSDTSVSRKLLAAAANEFPIWVLKTRKRALLQDPRQLMLNITAAKDGSGRFRTINEALELVPNNNERMFLIYIRRGVYNETVRVDVNKWNVVMYGDDTYNTIVTGSRNSIDGVGTIDTATFAAVGKNFMTRDMSFESSAGPQKEQAVALRSGSDFSVFFYRCSFVGYQDTLYTHYGHQFYRDCDIVGTIDFIFGAAVVLQNYNILPRQPLPNQQNTITAQGRTDPNANTGISIQYCNITPYDKVTTSTYLVGLGRIRTVVMQSNIGEIVNGEWWLEWIKGDVPPKTMYYAEYKNLGLGAGLEKRVSWPGHRSEINQSEAKNFDVETFIRGREWLPKTGLSLPEVFDIPFTGGVY